MDQEPSRHTRLSTGDLNVRLDGVEEILSGWSGQGSLFAALAAVDGEEFVDREWSELDVRARAGRILIEHVCPHLQLWPKSGEQWRPHLPVSSRTVVEVSASPRGRVNWTDTVRQFGWPARSFVTQRRHREVSDVTIATLAWTVETLEGFLYPATLPERLYEKIATPLAAAKEALALTSVPESLPRPDRLDLGAFLSSGRPWSYVEPVTAMLLRAEIEPAWLADQLLAPDPDLRWRLFHLSALGHVVRALRAQGASVSWRAPMGASSSKGPNFVGRLSGGTTVDVWFEAAGAYSFYGSGAPSVYSQVVRPIAGAQKSIGPDIGIFIPNRGQALLLECKFSWNPTYVSRNGFHQMAGYWLASQDQWGRVWSYILGPEEHVTNTSRVLLPGRNGSDVLGATSIPGLSALIADFLNPNG